MRFVGSKQAKQVASIGLIDGKKYDNVVIWALCMYQSILLLSASPSFLPAFLQLMLYCRQAVVLCCDMSIRRRAQKRAGLFFHAFFSPHFLTLLSLESLRYLFPLSGPSFFAVDYGWLVDERKEGQVTHVHNAWPVCGGKMMVGGSSEGGREGGVGEKG